MNSLLLLFFHPVKTLCQPGPCGKNTDCYISNGLEQCYCKPGHVGDPYSACQPEPISPCQPNPCGLNAECIVTSQGHSMCVCPQGMSGDPAGPGGCRGPECRTDDDCALQRACMGYKCRDPCPGACGVGALCRVEKHHPVCTCKAGLIGNPVIRCSPKPVPLPTSDPCYPSPCGANTQCQVMAERAVCSCLANFLGDPQTGCRPECTLNSDCPQDKACLDRQCKNPCSAGSLCGLRAKCLVREHTATCVCPPGHFGDAFVQCVPRPVPSPSNVSNPCVPSPCKPGAQCIVHEGTVAMCLGCGYSTIGASCRPECLTHSDCSFNQACMNKRCGDPCQGACGINADCLVINHNPVCSCPRGLAGNPFEHCSHPPSTEEKTETCEKRQCGSNAVCRERNGAVMCECKPGYYGDSNMGCRPECVLNSDCAATLSCINNKCTNPCTGVCGINAQCQPVNHIPVCYCKAGHTGDPFVSCYPIRPATGTERPRNPCDPSPCGPYSRCLVSSQGHATCSCIPGYQGSVPACRPECIVSSDCLLTHACVNQKCVDPCPGTCGIGARCSVTNHNPICSCPPGQQGDPFVSCYVPDETAKVPTNPCNPTPCGPNSLCQVKQGRPVCSCVANYYGSPPFCRPECVLNQECPRDKACINERCVDPCKDTCGAYAKCDVVNHTPYCSCLPGHQGDAFVGCSKIPSVVMTPVTYDLCNPSPCGENAQCLAQDGAARCTCIPPYVGNPYAGGCRPECVINSDCASNLACLSSHCRNPCQGLCGVNAGCDVVNHVPVCYCLPGHTGDPFQSCRKESPTSKCHSPTFIHPIMLLRT
ncbi:hypothetical protein PR048_009625 [Dryococelus australis]|uniref:EGF-like domain-containing protein n=1 Tax=Dryococelus australis TaxID=614101 RepID=A0ABQ9I0H4_9NEOP|nr:hypothetical protein PR048_009625 [Dryococelus australis]